jgi:hypothetical protein
VRQQLYVAPAARQAEQGGGGKLQPLHAAAKPPQRSHCSSGSRVSAALFPHKTTKPLTLRRAPLLRAAHAAHATRLCAHANAPVCTRPRRPRAHVPTCGSRLTAHTTGHRWYVVRQACAAGGGGGPSGEACVEQQSILASRREKFPLAAWQDPENGRLDAWP